MTSAEWYREVAAEIGRDLLPRVDATAYLNPPERPRLVAQRAAEIIEAPGPAEIVEAVAWAGCITLVASASGTGKTFVLLDLAAAVSAGVAWHGRETLGGAVAYLSCESDALGRRLRALRDVRGYRLEHVYVVRLSHPLSPLTTRDGEQRSRGELDATDALSALRDDLAEDGGPPIRLVIVDTVRASMTGSEDSSEHASAYLRAVKRVLAVVPEAGVILAHHAGWQDGEAPRKRERGSSAWRGNVDGTLYLEAGEYDRETRECPLLLRTHKVRDGVKPQPLHLIRRTVELPGECDRYGQPVTSCVVDRDRRSREDREAAQAVEVAAEHQTIDGRVLRVVVERPELAAAIDRIGTGCGLRAAAVRESVSRLIQRGHLSPPARQRQPYTATDAGRQALSEAQA